MITKSELIILLHNEQNSSFIVQKEEQMKKMPWLVRLKIKQKKCETFILVEHFLWIIFFTIGTRKALTYERILLRTFFAKISKEPD